MNKAWLTLPGIEEQVLGHIEDDGQVLLERTGRDELVGRVALDSGTVYDHRFGPNKKVGRVNLKNGKVYQSRLGPDQLVGRVDGKGRLKQHLKGSRDELVGKVDQFISYGHAGAALLLLVLPAVVETQTEKEGTTNQELSQPEKHQ